MSGRVTIWQALAARLRRRPRRTHEEACAEVRRILAEALERNARLKAAEVRS